MSDSPEVKTLKESMLEDSISELRNEGYTVLAPGETDDREYGVRDSFGTIVRAGSLDYCRGEALRGDTIVSRTRAREAGEWVPVSDDAHPGVAS